MTINPNNTTAACSGGEVTELHRQSASGFLCWPMNVIDLCKDDKDLPAAVEKLAAFIARWEQKGRTQASAPRSASAGATSLGISEDTAQLALDVHARRASPKVGPVGSDDDIRFLALSMAGEAGEAANVVKKAWRDGTPLNRPALAEEIAGTACYLIGIAAAIKINLNAEMREQMPQFELRYASNPLEGKGIQSKTEQASSGVRSPTSGEG